jgi:GNAT superfamily N-acetyltransferase
MPAATIRPAVPADTDAVFALIRGLAAYERLAHAVSGSAAALREHLFGARSYAEVLIAEADGRAVGFALFFHGYSTFLTRPGLYLEDLFVEPAYRRRGIGTALLGRVAALSLERECGRLEWSVLDWNAPAIAFYRRHGADVLPDWRICRVTGAALERLAGAG